MTFRLFCLLTFFLSLMLFGCESKTPEGYKYEIFIDKGQPNLQLGDEAFVYFEIRTIDSLLFVTPSKQGVATILTDPALNKTKKTGPIADLLPLLGEGDSAVVRIPVSEEMRVAQGLENADEIAYHVVVRKVNRSGSESIGKPNSESFSNSVNTDTLPNLRAKLKAGKKGLEELRILSQFIGQVKTENPELKKTASGIAYRIIKEGEGKQLQSGDQVSVNYLGSLTNGTLFAETYSNDLPFEFVYQQGRVIKGWDEGLGLVRKGGTLLLAVPSELAYGKLGKAPYIEPDETLYYYLELEN